MPTTYAARASITAVVLVAAAVLAPRVAAAQEALTTGIFARTGFVITSLDPSSMSFAPQQVRGHGRGPGTLSIDGKYLGWTGQVPLAGFSGGLTVDARWFYARVGADIYQNPAILANADLFDARFSTIAWVSAGPRFRVGPVVLSAGVRIGVLLMNVTETATGRDWSAVDGVYAVDAGIQWRPLRWFEVDANVGHDFFGPTAATTFSVAANFGWSRTPATAVTPR